MRPPIFPGTDPTSVRRRFHLPHDQPLVDHASRTNPLGPSPSCLAAARGALDSLSTRAETHYPRLVERIAEFHGINPRRVIVGAGATELNSLLGQSLRDVLAFHAQALGDLSMPLAHLVDPSSPSYRRVASRNELRAKVWGEHVLGWRQDVFPRAAAGIFWTGHPNNPTGRVWDRAELEAEVAAAEGLLTVVDESCLPFFPDEAERTLIPAANQRDNLLVLRSFSQFHALAGLPVGYAVASPDMITRLRQYQDGGTVSLAAEAAALAALDDTEHQARTVDLVARESSRLIERLWDSPHLQPAWPGPQRPGSAPSVPPFVLVSLTQTDWTSVALHEALARRGLLVRECSEFPGLEVGAILTGPDQLVVTGGQVRITVRSAAENDRLVAAMVDLLRQSPPETGQRPSGLTAP